MIIITGQYRSGTSMMMRCMLNAGARKAYTEIDHYDKERYPYGVFEGVYNGQNGLIKSFDYETFKDYQNPKIILMMRNIKQIQKSMQEKGDLENSIDYDALIKVVDYYNHIKVDYNKFVKTPDIYKEDFKRLFGEYFDFEKLKSGIDKTLYINR